MLISLVTIDRTSEKSKIILVIEIDAQISKFGAVIENDKEILSVSFDRELFELITSASNVQKASQTLIRAILAWNCGSLVSLPLVLSEYSNFQVDVPQ